MTPRLGLLGACACGIALSACASAPPRAQEPRPPGTGRVEVTVTGFQADKGQALVALFLSAAGWPNDQALSFGRAVHPIRDGQAVAEFEGVPAGPFAVSAFHDNDPALRAALEALALATGHAGRPDNGLIAVLPDANSRGAADLGVLPDRLPGYRPVEGEAGLSAQAMLAPDSPLKGILIVGVDPAAESEAYRAALAGLDFLVVQELFLTDTGQPGRCSAGQRCG